MSKPAAPVYSFGPFVLDVGDHSLKRDGHPIALTPKLFDLLVTLVAHSGRLLEKRVLLDTVWPDVAVEEGSLTKSIFSLRQALGQGETTVYIETVAKRGYRFTAAVVERPVVGRTLTPESVGPPIETAPPPAPNSIAVLPFADMSALQDQEFFCDGMSEEIINALGHAPELRVVSYTSSSRFKTKTADARAIGRELGVCWLLEGSVRKAGETMRIAVQLVRASDGFTAWSSRFDRQIESVFAVQDEIAGAIAQTLSREVPLRGDVDAATRLRTMDETTTTRETGPMVTSTTSNAKAYSLYLEGRYLWNKRPGKQVWEALDRFEQAVSIDPTFAPAHAAIASVYGILGGWEFSVISPVEAFAKAKAAATTALSLDPRLASAHAALAYTVLHFDWDVGGACRELEQALALNPQLVDAHHWQSHALCAEGRFEESLAASKRALDVDPINPLMHAHLAWHHYMAREFEPALSQSEHLLRIEPDFHWGHLFKGWALERLGRGSEAVMAFRASTRSSSESPAMLAGLGHALAAAQDRRAAMRVAEDLCRLREDKELYSYELGVIYAALGDRDDAFEWLTRARDERSSWMAYLRVDPRLDDLRADPRFERLSESLPLLHRGSDGVFTQPSTRPQDPHAQHGERE